VWTTPLAAPGTVRSLQRKPRSAKRRCGFGLVQSLHARLPDRCMLLLATALLPPPPRCPSTPSRKRTHIHTQPQAAEAEETALDIRKRKRLERDPLHQGLIVERSTLKQRDYQLDLTSRIGKSQVGGHGGRGGGWSRQRETAVTECGVPPPPQPAAPPPPTPNTGHRPQHAAQPAGGLLLQRVRLRAPGQPVIPGPHQRWVLVGRVGLGGVGVSG